jgi:hypothetical protein
MLYLLYSAEKCTWRKRAMKARRRLRWRPTRKILVAIGLVVVIALIFLEVRSYGTGFTGKTLWDWLNLAGMLAIPVVVGHRNTMVYPSTSQSER